MSAYYNEIDPFAAQWLRNLIAAGLIAPGDVDERSIVDVRADDLKGYEQCHFFAGIGGWSLALRAAGWPDDRPVWTGSCPCQPFSAAGAGKAADDERHLWPAWFSLIAECRPAIVFGEQVEAAVGWGWLDVVFADMEGESYACGAAILPACGIGAPHIRQRLWFVANAERGTAERHRHKLASEPEGLQGAPRQQRLRSDVRDGGDTGELADATHERHERNWAAWRRRGGPENGGELGHSGSARRQGIEPAIPDGSSRQEGRSIGEPSRSPDRALVDAAREQVGLPGCSRLAGSALAGFWSDAEWIACTDGKSRPVEPGSFPLGHGIPRRASKLRAYGNAIVPQIATEFIVAADYAIQQAQCA